MLVLIQRVSQAAVHVDDEAVGQIGPGLLALVGMEPGDTEAQLRRMAERLLGYRVFAEAERGFNRVVEICRENHAPGVETGRFGAHMVVSLVNDGPVTFLLRP